MLLYCYTFLFIFALSVLSNFITLSKHCYTNPLRQQPMWIFNQMFLNINNSHFLVYKFFYIVYLNFFVYFTHFYNIPFSNFYSSHFLLFFFSCSDLCSFSYIKTFCYNWGFNPDSFISNSWVTPFSKVKLLYSWIRWNLILKFRECTGNEDGPI